MSAIVFIHGSGCTGDAFRFQAQANAGSLAPNLPGHQAAGSAQTVEQFADFIEDYIAQRALTKVILCGNSLGGAIALEVALRKNPAVAGVIALGSGARLRVSPAILDGLRDRFESTVEELARHLFAELTPERVEYVTGSMRAVGREQTLHDFEACNAFDVIERLPEIRIPCLALTGAGDVMTPPKYAQLLADRVPLGQVRIIPGAGHLAMLERPEETNDAISDFVEALG